MLAPSCQIECLKHFLVLVLDGCSDDGVILQTFVTIAWSLLVVFLAIHFIPQTKVEDNKDQREDGYDIKGSPEAAL